MPRCEGRPEGACPFNKNDRTVRNSQGDLMLCGECERYRFPYISSASSLSSSSAGDARVTRSDKSGNKATGATIRTLSSGNSPVPGASCERKLADIDAVSSKSNTTKKQPVTQKAGVITDKVGDSSTAVSDTGVVTNCTDPQNNGTVKDIHDDLVTMNKAALTKEVMCLRDTVSQLKQKVEFLLSYVGVTDMQGTGLTSQADSPLSSANAAVLPGSPVTSMQSLQLTKTVPAQ